MKFIADAMLGKLAKRMRLLGFDVLYEPQLDDNEIIRTSLAQDRMILTRDTALATRPLASNHMFIKHDHARDQLDQVLLEYPSPACPLTRCTRCNTPLIEIPRQDALDLVPVYVFESKDAFFQCGTCNRIYWKGTHVIRMESTGRIETPGPGDRGRAA
jgi:uncharacterized protein with PIN domain